MIGHRRWSARASDRFYCALEGVCELFTLKCSFVRKSLRTYPNVWSICKPRLSRQNCIRSCRNGRTSASWRRSHRRWTCPGKGFFKSGRTRQTETWGGSKCCSGTGTTRACVRHVERHLLRITRTWKDGYIRGRRNLVSHPTRLALELYPEQRSDNEDGRRLR